MGKIRKNRGEVQKRCGSLIGGGGVRNGSITIGASVAEQQNTPQLNSCQDWNLPPFTNVASAHSSIQYRQIFWCNLIEVTLSYLQV